MHGSNQARDAKRKALSEALRGKNRVHKDRKHAVKRERLDNASLWRMLNTGV